MKESDHLEKFIIQVILEQSQVQMQLWTVCFMDLNKIEKQDKKEACSDNRC